MKKINGKVILIVVIWLLIIGLLVYSRFINLGWSLPYPMHPDERNMANAIQQLSCEFSNLKDCFNPHFFAYGQLPLYLGYFLIWVVRGFRDFGKIIINFEEAVMSLRIISAMASVINAIIIIKIIKNIIKKNSYLLFTRHSFSEGGSFISYLLVIFSPFFIQFSHFGTTESLLMLFYSLIVYLSMRLLERRTTYEVVWIALVSGLAVATKVSSAVFLVIPATAIIMRSFDASLRSLLKITKTILNFFLLTVIVFVIFSPHNLINFQDFVGSMRYESDVALGTVLVFYTRQFVDSIPIVFQFKKVFPYALGLSIFISSLLGLVFLSWRDKKINFLRFAILVYLIPSAFLYAKWSRFMSPVFPLMLVLAILFLEKIKVINVIKIIIVIIAILPGLAYLSIYQNPDVRFQASEWIYKNIPENSLVISETANVIDIPLTYKKNINVISFNFYDLDESPELQSELKKYLEKADYIFVPSRRLFANHLKDKYPLLNNYYNKLFSGQLGFTKVAEFSAGLNDEAAEETWTVFDHPVIRIYRRKSL